MYVRNSKKGDKMNYKENVSVNPAIAMTNTDKKSGTEGLAKPRKAHKYKANDVLWEIKSRRTMTEKHFHMSDGTDIAVA